ncbi:zinc-finger homeodomain protein 2-like [Rutidosis leptorrhynchoides]|uniref:zinc-finger homeodomain protein 2-like n=1 Tax=Rutidosis leptorrhynchoides TaxID=125765 RepID=UPI003A99EFE3
MESRERNSINYNNPPQSNQDSSPRLSTIPLISSPTSNSRRNHTLVDHQQQANHYHGFRRNPNPDPDPAPTLSQAPSQPPLPPSITTRHVAAVVVRYRECLKNHAANMGAHVLDGCGEFMPNGEDDTPEALKCAACECHRSFHRREVEGESQSSYHVQHTVPPPHVAAVPLAPAPTPSSQQQQQQQQQQHRYHHRMQPMMMAFGGANGVPAESSSEDLNIYRAYDGVGSTSKKRFRTKFTQEQKDKMQDFADRIGWKIQKQDEQEILQFCSAIGLKKQVFKVWMHNNKQTTKKKEQ